LISDPSFLELTGRPAKSMPNNSHWKPQTWQVETTHRCWEQKDHSTRGHFNMGIKKRFSRDHPDQPLANFASGHAWKWPIYRWFTY
jgi:hypothetical protein